MGNGEGEIEGEATIDIIQPTVFDATAADSEPKKPGIWDSELKLVNPVVYVHRGLLNLCETIQARIRGCEFSLLARGEWSPIGFVIGQEPYYIPSQLVGKSNVSYNESLAQKRIQEKFNVIVHSHGWNGSKYSSFSYADDNYINSHFECSLLFGGGTVADCSLKLPIANGLYLQLVRKNITEVIIYDDPIVRVEGIDRIAIEPELKSKPKKDKKGKKVKVKLDDGDLDLDSLVC